MNVQIVANPASRHPAAAGHPGCGVLGTATIMGETAGVHRFRSKAAFARFTGTAPVPVWSGNSSRVRLNRYVRPIEHYRDNDLRVAHIPEGVSAFV